MTSPERPLRKEIKYLRTTTVHSDYEGTPGLKSTHLLPRFVRDIVNPARRLWASYEMVTTLAGILCEIYVFFVATYVILQWRLPPPFSFPSQQPSLLNLPLLLLGFCLAFAIHEFSHAVTIILHGGRIESIGFSLGRIIGGFVSIVEGTLEDDQKVMTRFNATAIGANFLLAWLSYFVGAFADIKSFLWIATANSFVGFINALPLVPLDGGWLYYHFVNSVRANSFKKFLQIFPRLFILILLSVFIWLLFAS